MDMHIESAGEGSAVLFLHAGVADARMWRGQMNLTGYRSVVFDQRGFGKTPWVPGSYADWRDAVSVLDVLGIERATVVGCSIGGGIALHLALAAPERVDGLVLAGAAAGGWEPVEGWADDPLEDEAMAAANPGDLERAIELEAQIWLAGVGRELDEIDQSLVELFLDMDRIPASTEAERHSMVEPFGTTNDRLDEIRAKTLVVIGEYDQTDLIKSAQYLANRLSEQPAVVIDNAAHLPSLEQPEAFNAALLAFLNTL